MSDFSFWDIVRNLLTGLQWTLLLSLVAFVGGDCPDSVHQRLSRRNLARLRRLHRPRAMGSLGQPGTEPA
jgi:hypothetical protein